MKSNRLVSAVGITLATLLGCTHANGQDSANAPLTTNTSEAAMGSIDLSRHLWQARVILLFAASASDRDYNAMRAKLEEDSAAVLERDLVVYHLFFDRSGDVNGREITPLAARALADDLEVPTGRFTFLLVGKDGGVKMRAGSTLPVRAIFDTIDAMPMRQSEMKSAATKKD